MGLRTFVSSLHPAVKVVILGLVIGVSCSAPLIAGRSDERSAVGEAPAPTTSEDPQPPTLVPNVVGLAVSDARQQLNDVGLKAAIARRTSASKSPGTVIEQSLTAGSEVDPGSEVGLVVVVPSSLPHLAPIPDGGYGIGDSVMFGSREELAARNIDVLAEISSQFNDAPEIVRRLRHEGKLPRKVIIHLGTNGILIDPELCDSIVRMAGDRRQVYFVSIKIERWYRDDQNHRLRQCAARHDNAYLIDWWSFSVGHPEWFQDDGYHLLPDGQRRYASFLDQETSPHR